MKNTRRLLAIVIGVSCLLAAWPLLVRWRRTTEQARVLQSRSAALNDKEFQRAKRFLLPIFEDADRVNSFRLVSYYDALQLDSTKEKTPGAKLPGKIGDFYYSARGETTGADFAARLGKIVLDPRGYAPETLCKFDPTVAFQILKGTQTVTVAICFNCNQLMVVEPNPHLPLKSLGGIERHFRIGGVFDVYRPELVTLAQEVFPHDEKIQSLGDVANP